jgi:hypothetical protein
VLVESSGNLPLGPPKQATIEENTPIGVTMKNLKTTLLGDRIKFETSSVDIDGQGSRRVVPAKFVEEQLDKAVISQVLGESIHSSGSEVD